MRSVPQIIILKSGVAVPWLVVLVLFLFVGAVAASTTTSASTGVADADRLSFGGGGTGTNTAYSAAAAGRTLVHGRKLRSRPRNEIGSNATASNTTSIVPSYNGTEDNSSTSKQQNSHNSTTAHTIQSNLTTSDLNSKQGELLDGFLAVNDSHGTPGSYYFAHSPTEYDAISATDGWINVSTSTIHPPDTYDYNFHNSNNNNNPVISNSVSTAIFPIWGQLFLYIIWSLTIIFCCIIPSVAWFRRKAQEEQALRNNHFSITQSSSPARNAATSRRGLSVTHDNNNNTSSRSRLTLRQHLFINSPNWKKYVQTTLSATWKKTKLVVCKEHYCCSNNDKGRNYYHDETNPAKAPHLSSQQHNHPKRGTTTSTPGSPFKVVFATASRHAHARASTKTITPPSTPAKDLSNNMTPKRSPKKNYTKLANTKENSSTSSSSSRSVTSAATVVTTSSRPSIVSISNDSLGLDADSINSFEDEEEDISSVKSKSGLFLRIPAAANNSAVGKKSRSARKKTRTVPNSCAICLDCYEVGDTVVWSSTDSSCVHAFHEHCIAAWCFRKIEEQFTSKISVPCPCCRQPFVDLHLDFDVAMNSSISSNSTTSSNFQEAHQPTRRREVLVVPISPAIMTPVTPTTTSTRNPPFRRLEEEIAFEI